VGAFDFSKFDRFLGKSALQSMLLYGYHKSEQGAYDKTMLGLGTIGVWMPWTRRMVVGAGGWGIRWMLTPLANPVTATVTYAYVAGAITADAIDPDQGVDNYLGFTSGGMYGNNPNYLSGDGNDSGYFNIVQNFANILKAKRRAKAAKEQRELEAAYIRDYWMNAHLETLTQNWLAMTQAERDALMAPPERWSYSLDPETGYWVRD